MIGIFYPMAGVHIFFSFMMYTAFTMQNPPSMTAIIEGILGLSHDDMFRFVISTNLFLVCLKNHHYSLSPYKDKNTLEWKSPLEIDKDTKIFGFVARFARTCHRIFPNLWKYKNYRTQ